jgi:hypothetical protein
MSNFFHQLDLTVSNPVASRSLYEMFLGHCSFTLKSAGDTWAGLALATRDTPASLRHAPLALT